MILPMPKKIIADTSCFIILTNIGELELLQKMYGTVVTTGDIAIEFGEELPEWIEIIPVKDTYRQQLLEMYLDKWESSAIALALEIPDSTVIMDDFKARKIAERLGITFTGTLGIIIKAKLQGIIPSVQPFLEKIQRTNFRLSAVIVQQALREAGEQ
jgi:predicted nucleic acid-binding protein